MIEWINVITYIPPSIPEGHAQGCILRRSMVSVRWWQSGEDMDNYSSSRLVRTWRILAQVIICGFCCFSQRALHGVHSPYSHRSVVQWVGHMPYPCVCCLFLAGRVSFSTRAPMQSLTTVNQRRTKNCFLSHSSMWRTRPPKAGTPLPNGLIKPG